LSCGAAHGAVRAAFHCWLVLLRRVERRPAVPLSCASSFNPSGWRSQMPPNGLRRAALPQSCAEGKTQAPGGGLPASRMHQVSAFAGCAHSATNAMNTAPSVGLTGISSPLAFLHGTPALDKTPAGVMKQNNSNVRMKDMDKFTTLEGVAAPLKMINVDTDMIIPKQYLKTIKRTGLGTGLFAEKRYRDDGSENPDFVLNKPAYRKAKILVAGDNFGCGSSREHAPWALMDFGIRCVISTSFGDIFYNNCFKNGVLPIKVTPEDLEKLFDDAERGANATLSIDLEKQEIRGPDGGMVKFDIDPHRKHCLLNGLDDIGLTMVKKDKIERFEEKAKGARAWA
jgi:3-isopropylmalate/(R)-2-methylmalate dehydratase small subunit